MLQFINQIQEIIQNRSVPISNLKLKSIVESYSFLYVSEIIDSENNPDIIEKMRESELISICLYKREDNIYFIISFEQTIIIVHKESISFIKNLFLSHPKLIICFNTKTKQIFDLSMEIKYEETKLVIEDCYVEKYINEPMKNRIFIKILSSILQYIITKSFFKISQNNRIKKFNKKKQKPKIFLKEEFIRLGNEAGKGYASSAQLIYLIESEEIAIVKEPNDIDYKEFIKLQTREKSNYEKFNHPFIPIYYGVTKDNNNLVIEYINGKNLMNIKKFNFNENDKIRIIYNIMLIIQYFHDNKFILRDLKPDNILIDSLKQIFFIDFDRVISIDYVKSFESSENNNDKELTRSFCSVYTAPDFSEETISYKCDIYSLGMIIYYIMTEMSPENRELFNYFGDNSTIKAIYESCIQVDPKKRSTIHEILKIYYNQYQKQLIDINKQKECSHSVASVQIQHEISFSRIPSELESWRKSINNKDIKNIYDNFFFKYLQCSFIQKESENRKDMITTNDLRLFLLDYLKNYKFITYLIKNSKDKSNSVESVICIEKQCLIIDHIDLAIYKKVISDLKKKNISIINVSTKTINENETQEEKQAKKEVNEFSEFFKEDIDQNRFIKLTIRSIAGYLIRRYFYPSSNFIDESFFYFNQPKKPNNISKHQIFQKNEFIPLRLISLTQKALFELVIHIKSLYIFVMKTFLRKDTNEIQNEIFFCENYSHQEFTHFYGFLKAENSDEKIGCIYEFMSNGSLKQIVKRNPKELSELFVFKTIFLMIDGIEYLHSHEFIHGDLNPSNILINHNFAPYISDFDSVCQITKKENQTTNEIGSILYSSPEQDYDGIVSYPTDIYSFGLIIYFLYEHKDMHIENGTDGFAKVDEMNLPAKKASKGINNLIEECIIFDQEKRLTISQFKSKFNQIFYFSSPLRIDNKEKSDKEKSDDFNKIGDIYFFGKNVKQDYLIAKYYYELSSNLNNPKAQSNLGYQYFKGLGVNQDYSKAIYYYELAVKQKDAFALSKLGFIYSRGIGVVKDYSKAINYFKLAAMQNDSNALFNLGYIYSSGFGVEKDYSKAINYYQLAAKQNNSTALNNLGNHYFEGLGVEQDYSRALYYYELAAKQNNLNALNNLGNLYLEGLGVKKDYTKALYYFEKASKQNNPFIYINLGDLYYNGLGVQYDYLRAKFYYEKAVDNSEALYKLGILYLKGEGVMKDYNIAKNYFERSAQKNNHNALYNLGELYFNGKCVQQNYTKSKEYYEKASILGNSEAFFKLGYLYLKGYGVKQDYLYAKVYFEMSVKKENPDGLYFLGDLYSSVNFFEVNIEKSIQYFLKSIEIHYDAVTVHNKYDKSVYIKKIYNNYYYHSFNDLGLIYITVFQDISKGNEYIKEAAFAEYPFAQNNFGLIYELYFNHHENAEYMYKRSSSNNFALAEYNLGYQKEKENKVDESIEYYRKASEHEDFPLVFHNFEHYDKRLEISKMFIFCFINLKLSEYYFSKSNHEESKKYFIKAFSKLSNDTSHQFELTINNEKEELLFIYLKNYILHFKVFNLINQPFLSPKIKKILESKEEYNMTNKENDTKLIKKIKCDNVKKDYNLLKSGFEDNLIIKNANDLFDFIVSNKKYMVIFSIEIKQIIEIMKEIIYTPPYSILFGRISIEKLKKKQGKSINKSFYDGLGLDEFQK